MSCGPFRRTLVEAALGALAGDRLAALDRHVAGCAACAAELAALRATLTLIDRARPLPGPRTDVWERLAPALAAADAERRRAPWWRRLAMPRLVPVLAPLAAALLVAVLAAVLVARRPAPPTASPVAAGRAAPVLDARVDRYLERATPLVVALANRGEQAAPEAFNGAAERRLARALARDGRELAAELAGRDGGRERELVADLAVVFMQLGNTQPGRHRSGTAIARDTIERRGLLFALSLAELRRAGATPRSSRAWAGETARAA